MDDRNHFKNEVEQNIYLQGKDTQLHETSINWLAQTSKYNYSYMSTWMGLPIIQIPQDIVAMQELIWKIKPDLIVETGVARGGGVIFYSSMLELLGNSGTVIGIDIDIRAHNRAAIDKHPMAKNVWLIEDSSTSPAVIKTISDYIKSHQCKQVLVTLDSNHTHEHVLEELRLYSTFVKKGGYIVVFDTTIEDMPVGLFPDRPWSKTDNPKTAVRAFLEENNRFEIDKKIDNKLLLSVAIDGYLKCVR